MGNFNRLRTGLTCGEKIFLVVWSPFGAVLCILRCIFLFLAIVFYPLYHCLGLGNWYARFWLPILGYFVTIRGRDTLRASSAPVVVSNHTSDFDACAMWAALPPSQLALVMNDHWKSVVDKVRSVGWPMVAIFTSGTDTKEKIKEALPHGSPPPHRVLMFPEGCTCSGIAVQQFNWFVFGLARPVLPCAIRLTNPWPVQMQMNGISVAHNILALFFLPYVSYEIEFLPEVSAGNLSKEDFAHQVRMQICETLRVPGTVSSLADKKAYGKLKREGKA